MYPRFEPSLVVLSIVVSVVLFRLAVSRSAITTIVLGCMLRLGTSRVGMLQRTPAAICVIVVKGRVFADNNSIQERIGVFVLCSLVNDPLG